MMSFSICKKCDEIITHSTPFGIWKNIEKTKNVKEKCIHKSINITWFTDSDVKRFKKDRDDRNNKLDYIKINSTCFAERTWNYIQYGLTRLKMGELHGIELSFYKTIRIDGICSRYNPKLIASFILYTNAIHRGFDITQRDICYVLNISEPTIRRGLKLLKPLLEKEINNIEVKS